jgi:hypothetical protein
VNDEPDPGAHDPHDPDPDGVIKGRSSGGKHDTESMDTVSDEGHETEAEAVSKGRRVGEGGIKRCFESRAGDLLEDGGGGGALNNGGSEAPVKDHIVGDDSVVSQYPPLSMGRVYVPANFMKDHFADAGDQRGGVGRLIRVEVTR